MRNIIWLTGSVLILCLFVVACDDDEPSSDSEKSSEATLNSEDNFFEATISSSEFDGDFTISVDADEFNSELIFEASANWGFLLTDPDDDLQPTVFGLVSMSTAPIDARSYDFSDESAAKMEFTLHEYDNLQLVSKSGTLTVTEVKEGERRNMLVGEIDGELRRDNGEESGTYAIKGSFQVGEAR